MKKTHEVQAYKYYHDSGLEAVMLLHTTKIKQCLAAAVLSPCVMDWPFPAQAVSPPSLYLLSFHPSSSIYLAWLSFVEFFSFLVVPVVAV